MTEKDLGQKVAARRLLWRMGYSTRIDVVLRAVELANPGRGHASATPASFTDLDVLGVAVTPSGEVQTCIVDCKTGNSSIIGRMFWVRGLVELFGAHASYMVRDRPISADAKQLAARLGITALNEVDLTRLEELMPTEVPLDSHPLTGLFDAATVTESMSRYTTMDRGLKPLLDFRQFNYWVYPDHRNLIELPDTLLSVASTLKANNPQHVGLLLDCAWLYTLSLARCVGALRGNHIADLNYGLSEYLVGGPTQLKQQHEIATLLVSLQEAGQIPTSTKVTVNPRFFEQLLELVVRLLRRGTSLNATLRLLEFQSESAMLGRRHAASTAFGAVYDRTAAKIAVDVVEFLVSAANLDPHFVAVARDVLTSVEGPGSKTSAPAVAGATTAPLDGNGAQATDAAPAGPSGLKEGEN
ncbi:hypothetical protein [Demequina sp. NBRC 110057]|uniref:hypothetical protein n=1 Tax=Demequina sp. NBRC 110057 TaxID=1570346 RepID=UPI001177AA9E|nr:hypothetical protein [Demequina sp. NBRC 110057]